MNERSRPRIGSILMQAGLLTDADLQDALDQSIEREIPVGRVLVESGVIQETLLQAALDLQSRIASSQVQADVAVVALNQMARFNKTIDVALADAITLVQTDLEASRLGDLLCSSGIATRDKLEEAVEICTRTKLPLGKILIATGLVWDELLETALELQKKVRAGELSLDVAVSSLQHEFEKPIPWKPM